MTPTAAIAPDVGGYPDGDDLSVTTSLMIEGKRRGEQLKLRGCSPEDFREIAALLAARKKAAR
jgi:hypothetical protein